MLVIAGGHEMPFREQSIMDQKAEFVRLAEAGGCSFRALCDRWGISRPTGYKRVARAQGEGLAGLAERSRRPGSSPARTPAALEQAVVAVRTGHPTWGGWKIHHYLRDQQHLPRVPSPSTCTAILHRHGLIAPDPSRPRAWTRFEAAAPNALWRLDFKGHVAMGERRLHPLTVVDDHSRYLLGLRACPDEQDGTVRGVLTELFGRYGLPACILTDNGPPWGSPYPEHPWTALGIWLVRLGIRVSHGRPLHPQTQGKVERLHGTLAADLLATRAFADLPEAQAAFDGFRAVYNGQRPHAALGGAVPATRYRPSARPLPDPLPPLVYAPDDHVRAVGRNGQGSFRGRPYFVGAMLRGEQIALRATGVPHLMEVRSAHLGLGELNLEQGGFTPARSTRAADPV
jgi:transposase InsO family protein